jgi:hypothetical protein
MQATLDVACSSRLHGAGFFSVIPYPDTELYAYVAKHAPDKLKDLDYDGMEFVGSRINLSEVADEVLFRYKRAGFRRFYLNPARLARIVRDYPNPWFLPYYLPMYLNRVTKGLFAKG